MLLKALIYYLIATRPEQEQNLASCAELVRAANKSGGSNLLTDLMSQLPYDHPARMNYKSIEIAPEKTYSSILSTLQSKLGKFDSKEIAALTSTDTIKFEDIGTKKTALYVISPDTHTAYNFLLTIFFAQLINQLYNFADDNGGKLKEPVYFILDEFANIGQIPDFDQKISTSRSRKISFSVILQNLDQLEAIYEKSYETIMGNCDTHLFLGSNSYKTLEYFSKALGNCSANSLQI
jgi:type IV secretion system protein VirD4